LNKSRFKDLEIFLEKNKNIFKDRENFLNSIYLTPIGINDDLFWIYASLFNDKSLILTNDEMKDHIFYINNDIINKWKKNKIINYTFDKDKENNKSTFNYNFPLNYTKNIQYINSIWHFPIIDSDCNSDCNYFNYICLDIKNLFITNSTTK
jgi:hypothetical protein